MQARQNTAQHERRVETVRQAWLDMKKRPRMNERFNIEHSFTVTLLDLDLSSLFLELLGQGVCIFL